MATELKVENLGKKYLIKHQTKEKYTALRDVITDKTKNLISSMNPFTGGEKKKSTRSVEEFWALRDIDFEIEQGDKVGIIGRNGAGKSTLLKLLSRITEPTTGKISYNGRVASLLEVGTGFHPELTGRENIYLNGAILGMSKSDIKRQFDEIVEFAEVEKFLDTPVKRYSSGMYVRLGFAVAAHIDTEILIVDEVLAVGDAKFQKKSLEKMNSISESGRTLLFVSHNMGAVSELCNKGIMLDKGKMVFQGDTNETINQYNNFNLSHNHFVSNKSCYEACIKEIYLTNEKNQKIQHFDLNEPIEINIIISLAKEIIDPRIALTLSRNLVDVFHTSNLDHDTVIPEKPGNYKLTYKINPMFIKEGYCSISVNFGTGHGVLFEKLENVLQFDIVSYSFNTMKKGYYRDRPGSVIMQGDCYIEEIE